MNIRGLSMAQIKRITNDLALSIGVHPWAFGIRPEGTGHLVLPPGITVEASVVTNMAAFRATGATEKFTWEHNNAEFHLIPAFIQSIRILVKRKAECTVRATVVVEHRNLKQIVTGAQAIPGVIFVMVCPFRLLHYPLSPL